MIWKSTSHSEVIDSDPFKSLTSLIHYICWLSLIFLSPAFLSLLPLILNCIYPQTMPYSWTWISNYYKRKAHQGLHAIPNSSSPRGTEQKICSYNHETVISYFEGSWKIQCLKNEHFLNFKMEENVDFGNNRPRSEVM